jgi:hypothetical protein
MSRRNTLFRCSSCDYVGWLVHRPITLIYELLGGEKFRAGRKFCWCNTCGEIRNSETDFSAYLDVDGRIADLQKATRKLGKNAYNLIEKLLSGSSVSNDESELHELILGRKIARARSSGPRCLTCGETNIQNLNEYIHTCGGQLIRDAPSDDGSHFNYAPETIYLDYEGRKLSGPIDPYIQFAQTVKIEVVMKDGVVALVYICTRFDEEDFASLLSDKEKFRRFARIIELRIMHDDFDNPLSQFVEKPTPKQQASISEAPRAIVLVNQKPISKWLRVQVMTR